MGEDSCHDCIHYNPCDLRMLLGSLVDDYPIFFDEKGIDEFSIAAAKCCAFYAEKE